jgi:hypothetical protein
MLPPTLNTIFDALLRAQSQALDEIIPTDEGRQIVAAASYATGFQAALELGQLEPEIARLLITALHDTQHAADPEAHREWNQTASTFAQIYRRNVALD